jgi:hypothetical protein
MKRVFFAESMQSTPFQEGRRRDSLDLPDDIRLVDNAPDADIVVARFHYELAPHFQLGRQYYLWTHEPNWCSVAEKQFVDAATGHVIHASTAWNGDIYVSPLYFFPFYRLDLEELRERARSKSKSCVVIATFRRKFDRYQGGVNVDLTEYRQRLAIGLQNAYDYCDIFGRSWPEDVRLSGESRGLGWHESKQEILQGYAFNLALENTVLSNYVTEKLWDAYSAACVPIYFGQGTGINEVLSDGSFIDCSGISSAGELYERLASVSLNRRLDIIGSAVSDIEKMARSTTRLDVARATVARFVERVREL